jgi:RimJ/RimL family protein N-acetyltransferase
MRVLNAPQPACPGIALRQLERSDLHAWYSVLSHPETVEHTSWNLHSEQDLLPVFAGIESTDKDSGRRLAIIDQHTDALIGTIGLHTVSSVNLTAEIAYELAPAYWGRGIASAVCSAFTAWSFSTWGFVRIQGTVLESNVRSEAVLRKCGFRHEGLLRAYRMVRGTPGNYQMYARLSSD